jgi:hypothetical protein
MSSYDAAIIDTEIIEHPDLIALPRNVRLVHIEALVWSKLHHTDGSIPALSLRRLTDEPEYMEAARLLVDAGLWRSSATGWSIVGFLDKQWSAERVKHKRDLARERYSRWQDKQDAKPSKPSNALGNAAANGPDLTRPDLTRPDKEGRQEGDGAAVALAERVVAVQQNDPPPISRRELGRIIREAPTDAMRNRYRRIFDKSYGELYHPKPRAVA